jgi:sarcosine oxidase
VHAAADVVVVGAGLVGMHAAAACARRGMEVVVLERFGAGHARGSSHGTERLLRFAYTDPLYVELTQRSVPWWTARGLFDPCGCIDVGEEAELAALRSAMEASGVTVEEVDPSAQPDLTFDGPAIFQPDAGVVQVARALEVLAGDVDVERDSPVTRIEERGDTVVVHVPGGPIQAGTVVVAAGAWARTVVPEHIELPAITVTEEIVGYFRYRDGAAPLPAYIHRTDPPFYALPTPDGRYKIGEHGTGEVVDPDARDERWRKAGAVERLSALVERFLPSLDPTPDDALACLYATTPTDDPVIDHAGRIVIAAGFGGHGAKLSPAAGDLIADVVEGGAAPAQLRLGAVIDNPFGFR